MRSGRSKIGALLLGGLFFLGSPRLGSGTTHLVLGLDSLGGPYTISAADSILDRDFRAGVDGDLLFASPVVSPIWIRPTEDSLLTSSVPEDDPNSPVKGPGAHTPAKTGGRCGRLGAEALLIGAVLGFVRGSGSRLRRGGP